MAAGDVSYFQVGAAGAVTASGNSAMTVQCGITGGDPHDRAAQYLNLHVDVSAVSGTTPSLTIEIQWSNDGVNFASVQGTTDSLTAITATGNVCKQFNSKGQFARLKYTVSGTTPSFTFDASASMS